MIPFNELSYFLPTECDNEEEKKRGDPHVVKGQKAQGGPEARREQRGGLHIRTHVTQRSLIFITVLYLKISVRSKIDASLIVIKS